MQHFFCSLQMLLENSESNFRFYLNKHRPSFRVIGYLKAFILHYHRLYDNNEYSKFKSGFIMFSSVLHLVISKLSCLGNALLFTLDLNSTCVTYVHAPGHVRNHSKPILN